MNIHAEDPYKDFNAEGYPDDVHGWGSQDPIFKILIDKYQPKTIIEVGTWKGASAIHMASLSAAKIVCVDTWLGALEFWAGHNDPERSLNLVHGYPSVYYQFLANVVRAGYQDRIYPFPQTSLIAARWFKKNAVTTDMIYLDGSHDYEDVLADLRAYWDILKPGGILLGDDLVVFMDVKHAVETFCAEKKIRYETDAVQWKWWIIK